MGKRGGTFQPGRERYPNGRPKPLKQPRDYGCDGVIRRRKIHGAAANDDQSCDALGRAYLHGLLGTEGRSLLYAGRRLQKLYRPEIRSPASSLAYLDRDGGRTTGKVAELAARREEVRIEDYEEQMAKVERFALPVRNAFYDLVLGDYPDHGPEWLDRIIFAKRSARQVNPYDDQRIRQAVRALQALID